MKNGEKIFEDKIGKEMNLEWSWILNETPGGQSWLLKMLQDS